MTAIENQLTMNYLQFCYTCEKAHECDTELKCKECWQEKENALAEEAKPGTTEELLRQYAL